MEVILADSVKNLGDEGEIVRVRDGYARNYLIPRGLAFSVDTANAKQVEHRKKILLDQRRRKIKTEEDLARRLADEVVRMPMKAGEGDKLFGSVTSSDIAKTLANRGLYVDRRKIQLDEPIKSLGSYNLEVRFSGEVSGELKVEVVKE